MGPFPSASSRTVLVGFPDTRLSSGQFRPAESADISYSAVVTTLTRLLDKGAVSRSKAGRAYRYSPVRDAAGLVAERMSRLLTAEPDPRLRAAPVRRQSQRARRADPPQSACRRPERLTFHRPPATGTALNLLTTVGRGRDGDRGAVGGLVVEFHPAETV